MSSEQKGNIPAHGKGSALIATFSEDDGIPTDASPAKEFGPYNVRGYNDIGFDLITNKGCTAKLVPMFDADATGAPQREGKASTSITIGNGGGSERAIYSGIRAPFVKLVITKTEAGNMTDYYGEITGGL